MRTEFFVKDLQQPAMRDEQTDNTSLKSNRIILRTFFQKTNGMKR